MNATNGTMEPPATNGSVAATCFILMDRSDVLSSHKWSTFLIAVLVIVGIIGNSLSIMVFSSKAMKRVSSSSYLLMLAVSDSMYLISVFCTNVLKNIRCFYFIESFIDIANRSAIMCKMTQFSLDMFSDYSTFLILAFTAERMIAVFRPHRYKEICTVTRARIACVVALFAISILTGPYHFIFMGKYVDGNGTEIDYCTVTTGKVKDFTIMYITEYFVLRLIPILAIAVLNVFIIVRATRFAREHRKGGPYSDIKRKSKNEKTTQMTVMLIVVSSTYILVYLPMAVHFVLAFFIRQGMVTMSRHIMLIIGNYTKAIYVSGFSINFLLYTISGRTFREQLKKILCVKKIKAERHLES